MAQAIPQINQTIPTVDTALKAPVIAPVAAPIAPVVAQTPAPVIGTPTPTVSTAAPTNTILSTVNPSAVYAAPNIQQIDVPSARKAADMKLSKLEGKLAKASSIEELNQIAIMNQPKAMGVLSGEASYRSKLDSARLNAFNGLYQNRLAEEQRKEVERQKFIEMYGADPKKRPKGMSRREFSTALQAGQFKQFLTEDFKQKQLDTAAKKIANSKASLSASTPAGANSELVAVQSALTANGNDWGKTANDLASKGYDVSSGSVIDNELRRRNGLEPVVTKTPAQIAANQQIELDKQKGLATAQKALNIVNSLSGSSSLGAAVGPISSKIPTLRGGTADFEANFNALRSLLTLENMGVMKGALSDSDMKVITQASTALNLGMSEDGFKTELNNVKTILQNRLGQETQNNNTNNVSIGTITEKNGKRYRKVANGWEEL